MFGFFHKKNLWSKWCNLNEPIGKFRRKFSASELTNQNLLQQSFFTPTNKNGKFHDTARCAQRFDKDWGVIWGETSIGTLLLVLYKKYGDDFIDELARIDKNKWVKILDVFSTRLLTRQDEEIVACIMKNLSKRRCICFFCENPYKHQQHF